MRMQTYSVFDYKRCLYKYYEAPLDALPATGSFREPQLGGPPESLAVPLPAGARFVGEGTAAKGLIAKQSSSSALGFLDFSELPFEYYWWYYAGLGITAWVVGRRLLQKRKRSRR